MNPLNRFGGASLSLALMLAALAKDQDSIYGDDVHRRVIKTPPQKSKAIKVVCTGCGNSFKSKVPNNTCKICHHSGRVTPEGKF